MACNNCFNGCADIISDNCIKYTGPNIPELGIETGDTLASVEGAIFSFLVPVLTGVGIKPTIEPSIICDAIKKYLPVCNNCGGFTLNEILTAIIKAVCDIQDQVTDIAEAIEILNQDYTLECINTVSPSSGTHSVLQAVISKLCSVDGVLNALIIALPTTYVSIAAVNDYIQAYLESSGITSNISSKMVPNTAVEYYGSLTQFDVTGAGTGIWEKIYLCNGNNGTPDKRGRVPVGTTSGMGGGVFNAAVDPGIVGNPSYSLGTTGGANNVTLFEGNLPAHTHVATVTDPGHDHDFNLGSEYSTVNDPANTNVKYLVGDPNNTSIHNANADINNQNYIEDSTTGITVTNASTGGGLPHSNIQPVLACHYIIYIP